MRNPYAIPKHTIPVEVTLEGPARFRMGLFLGDLAPGHAGAERPSDLLNGSYRFLPLSDEAGEVVLIQRDAMVVVSVPEEHETIDLPASSLESVRLEITLLDGSSLRGRAVYALPEGQRRLQDFLNDEAPFLPLREMGWVRFLNKRRIARVRPLPHEARVEHGRPR